MQPPFITDFVVEFPIIDRGKANDVGRALNDSKCFTGGAKVETELKNGKCKLMLYFANETNFKLFQESLKNGHLRQIAPYLTTKILTTEEEEERRVLTS